MFLPEITVTIEKELVRFAMKRETLELRPEVYLDQNQPPRVLSVGTPPSEPVSFRVVHLFDGKESEEDKILILEAFFRYAFRKLRGGSFGLAPIVTFELSANALAALGGYHRFLLHHCAKMAGAKRTSYEAMFKHA